MATLPRRTFSPSLRWGYTLFLLLLVSVYGPAYGPFHFLWFSDLALFLILGALWLESRLLASMAVLAALVPSTAWSAFFLTRLAGGPEFPGIGYMFDPEKPLELRLLSLFHLGLPPLLLWLVRRMGYDRRALPAQTLLAWGVLLVLFFSSDPLANINFVFGFAGVPLGGSPVLHLLFLMVCGPLLIYLPLHGALKRWTKEDGGNRRGAGARNEDRVSKNKGQRTMHRLSHSLLGAFTFLLLLGNTIFWCLPLYLLALLKLLPLSRFRRSCNARMIRLGMGWLDGTQAVFRWTRSIDWEVELPSDLHDDGWYLVVANHQSWVDILALEHLFHRRIPFLKFFTKKQLRHLPFIGPAIKGLDFPLVERHSKEEVTRRPELKGRDFETARSACERYRSHPISIVIFPEGTRFTPAKHDGQQSPYRHLLVPKAGGIGAVATALGDRLHGVLDVTIVYPQGPPSFWDHLCGRCTFIVAKVRCRPVPAEWPEGDYGSDPEFREGLRRWLEKAWEEKDAKIGRIAQKDRS